MVLTMKFYGLWFLGVYIFALKRAVAETHILYDTKRATSDLDWTLYPSHNAWEEVSSLDLDGSTIRSYQVCNVDSDEDQNNWARLPYIDARFATRIYIDIEFSIMKCPKCRETFGIYYYPSSSDVASTTFPPWRENPYIKLDTLAASERFESSDVAPAGINKKTLIVESLEREGFYLALQDEGACMSVMSLKLYYFYCPEQIYNLAYFPTTVAGGKASTLVTAIGTCVANAIYMNNQVPLYRCNSNGEWMIPTSSCTCNAGYTGNKTENTCLECPIGYYKSSSGNEPCLRCPSRSQATSTAATYCQCKIGYYRATSDTTDAGCTGPPSEPSNLTYHINEKALQLQWQPPITTGNRDDLYYSISCKHCDEHYEKCKNCSSKVYYLPANINHVTQTSIEISNLEELAGYVFTVSSLNGVSSQSSNPPSTAEIKVPPIRLILSKVENIVLVKSSSQSLTFRWTPAVSSEGRVVNYEIQLFLRAGMLKVGHPTVYKVKGLNTTIGGLNSDTEYQVRVRGLTEVASFGPFSSPFTFRTSSRLVAFAGLRTDTLILISGAAAGLCLLVIILTSLVIAKRRKAKKEAEELRIRSKQAEETYFPLLGRNQCGISQREKARKTYVDYRDPHQGVKEVACEIEPYQIKIERVIGQGEFAEVCRCKLLKGKKSLPVAVKRLRYGSSLIDQTNFFREACTMAQFSHPNIVEFKGIVTKSVPPMIVTEFMDQGSLDRFLQKRRGELSMLQLLRMLRGIASGMSYLSSMKYIHRDLAARNILVDSELNCKVSDFGLSRTLENDPHATYTTQGGKIALRWTAPECIRLRQFTSASDVWSFGVLIWEVMSYGQKPYWDMSNDDVTQVIEDGFRLPAPANCPRAIYKLMLRCWEYDVKKRPSFKEIFNQLENFMKHPNLLTDDTSSSDDNSILLTSSESNISHETVDTSRWRTGYRNGSQIAGDADNIEKLSHTSARSLVHIGNSLSGHKNLGQNGLNCLRTNLDISHASILSSRASTILYPTPTGSVLSSLPGSSTLLVNRVDLSQAGALV